MSCMFHYSLIRSSIDGNWFARILDIVNNAAMDMIIQISLCDSAFNIVGCIPISGIARSYGNSVLK